jgi:CRISPR system Cascade subunit CasA
LSFSYNIAEQPFVPCIMADGRREFLGLRDTLLRAAEVREVHDPSPPATVALHRLLLAILHRNFGPSTIGKWTELWGDGAGPWDAKTLNAYFDQWHDRFDLFHEERPFYQVAEFTAKDTKGISVLARHLASGNNPTLFDHSTDDQRIELNPDEAGRLLVAEQAFGVAGLGGGTVNGKRINFIDGPCTRGASVFLQGGSLFQTLMLNFVRYADEAPFQSTSDDAPAWELETPTAPDQRPPRGYLEYLTWQSRLMRLVPEEGQDGEPRVRCMHRMQGLALNEEFHQDPFMSYRLTKKRGPQAWRLSEERAPWRDSSALLQVHEAAEAHTQAPASFNWAARLIWDGVLPPGSQYNFAVLGLCARQAKINLWRHERMPLPLSYLREANLVETLTQALDVAETCGQELRSATRRLAKLVLAPNEARTPDRDAVTAVVDSLNLETPFWSRLETPFRSFYLALPGNADHQREKLRDWAKRSSRTAAETFDEGTRSAGLSPRMLKAVTRARRQLGGALAAAIRPILEEGGNA